MTDVGFTWSAAAGLVAEVRRVVGGPEAHVTVEGGRASAVRPGR